MRWVSESTLWWIAGKSSSLLSCADLASLLREAAERSSLSLWLADSSDLFVG